MKVGAAIPLLLLLVSACGEEGSDDGGEAGSGGSAGASGSSASAGTGGISDGGSAGTGGEAGAPFVPPENPDALALEACELDDPCPESYIQEAESSGYYVLVEGSACLLEALARRTPGRYLHDTDSTWGNSGTGAEHRLVITVSGSVLYARTAYEYFDPFDPDAFPRPDPGQRCTLKPPEFFEACRDVVLTDTPAIEDYYDAPLWLCLFGDGTQYVPTHLNWFESCETESPLTCE